jgi:glycosyltransferase involved in cell wall biosynthesis
MALGTPIIASRVGGLAEVLQHGVTALLVSSGDTTSLAQAIGRLYGDPELHRRLSENARHLQQAQYSLEAMTKRYLDVYREVLFATGFPS